MESNLYIQELNIPVPFIPYDISTDVERSNRNLTIVKYELSMINEEYRDWFTQYKIRIGNGWIFYAPPGAKYNLHVDVANPNPNNFAKINYVVCGKDSHMIWYELLPGRNSYKYQDQAGNTVIGYKIEDCVEVHRAHVQSPSLINVGTIHTMHNPTEPRIAYTTFMMDLDDGHRLTFTEAADRLANVISTS
jgi:hypothetical protein